MAFLRPRVGLGATIALVLCAVVPACDDPEPTACTFQGFAAGLLLHFAGPGGAALPASTYEIALTVDGDVYALACFKVDDASDFMCEPAEGSGDHDIVHEDEFGTGDFFDLRISRHVGDGVSGPQDVVVEVIAGDAPLVDETFRPTYERDEPNGDGCGFIDHEVRQDVVIDVGM